MIKNLIMDVDGTLTDGIVYFGDSGEICKGFYVRDGLGIQSVMKKGITPVILTSRNSELVKARANDLGIKEVYIGVKDKRIFLENYMKSQNVHMEELAYIADDVNDLEAIQLAGHRGCPSDAVMEIRNVCNFVSNYPGGHGAVREFCDYLQRLQWEWTAYFSIYKRNRGEL